MKIVANNHPSYSRTDSEDLVKILPVKEIRLSTGRVLKLYLNIQENTFDKMNIFGR